MYLNSNKRRLAYEENQTPEKKRKMALYLDNNTPIRTVEVTNIADDVYSDYLRGYFEFATGPVSNVKIAKTLRGNQEMRVAYVTFLIPEDAARLISDLNLQSQFKFTVKEAESHHQPKINSDSIKFDEINNDCLLKIASYLELGDIINLGKTNIPLRSFANQIYHKNPHFSFGTITGDSSINEFNVQTALKEMGIYIKSIEWYNLNSNHLDYLSQYCPNVTKLRLIYPSNDLHLAAFKKNKKFVAKIKILDIEGALFFDSAMKAITSSSKLQHLQLQSCNNLRGKFLGTWKNNNLKSFKIINCPKVGHNQVFDFLQKNELIRFWYDSAYSFEICLRARSECLLQLEELELDFSYCTNEQLKSLNFKDFIRLTDLTVTCKFDTFDNSNTLFAALLQIDTLKSLNISKVLIDHDTVMHLGALKNLQNINFNFVRNTIGEHLFSSLPVHLPKLTILTISMHVIDFKWICDMISSLHYLKYFSCNQMTWKLLKMIQQQRQNQSTIEIGVSKALFYDQRKKQFSVASKNIKLSLNE